MMCYEPTLFRPTRDEDESLFRLAKERFPNGASDEEYNDFFYHQLIRLLEDSRSLDRRYLSQLGDA